MIFRRPFVKDELIKYEYDSDEDWQQEEEEGESLSDNEDDEEDDMGEDDDYEVDNEFLVPHGYLSYEEEEKEEDEIFNPETAKKKAEEVLKYAEKDFRKGLERKTKQLKPRMWGVCFEGENLNTEAATKTSEKSIGGFTGILTGNNCYIETGFCKTGTTRI